VILRYENSASQGGFMEKGIKAGEEIKHLRACIVDQADNQITINHQADDIADLRQQVDALSVGRDTLKRKYMELIMAVADKYPFESRHGTALRYIKERQLSGQVKRDAGLDEIARGQFCFEEGV